MTETVTGRLNRGEFVQGTRSGASSLPAAGFGLGHSTGAIASFVGCLYALA
jgi:hypothetical protein